MRYTKFEIHATCTMYTNLNCIPEGKERFMNSLLSATPTIIFSHVRYPEQAVIISQKQIIYVYFYATE